MRSSLCCVKGIVVQEKPYRSGGVALIDGIFEVGAQLIKSNNLEKRQRICVAQAFKHNHWTFWRFETMKGDCTIYGPFYL